jgi:hypothetical protein
LLASANIFQERNMRLVLLIFSGLLAALPAAGQTILGVLGGTGVGGDDAGAVVSIHPVTGAATVLGTPIAGESLTGVARLNDGRIVASTATFGGNSRLIEIDPATGALIQNIGDFNDGQMLLTLHDLTVDPDTGVLYGISIGVDDRPAGRRPGSRRGGATAVTGSGGPGDEDAIFVIDPATALCTFVGTAVTDGGFVAIAFSADGMDGVPTNVASLHAIDASNGSAGPATPIVGSDNQGALGMALLEEGPNPQFLISACCSGSAGNDIYRLDATGAATLLGSAGGTRRVHDMVVIPGVGPGPGVIIVEVPVLGRNGIVALALLLTIAGSALLFWRR